MTGAAGLEGLVLRFGWFYGPGTYYDTGGSMAAETLKRRNPIVGAGTGTFSFIHIDDAAAAVAAALDRGTPGAYNVVDDEPAQLRDWLPVYAETLGAKQPRRVPVWLARLAGGARSGERGDGDARRLERQGQARAGLGAGAPELAPGLPRLARLAGRPPARARLRMRAVADLDAAKQTLLAELREHSLVLGEVTLSSGATAQYYVDARRTLMRPAGFRAAGELIAAVATELGAEAVGGPATAAIPPACAAIAVPAGDGLVAFFVRGERKEHGLQRWVEGPVERRASAAWSSRTR